MLRAWFRCNCAEASLGGAQPPMLLFNKEPPANKNPRESFQKGCALQSAPGISKDSGDLQRFRGSSRIPGISKEAGDSWPGESQWDKSSIRERIGYFWMMMAGSITWRRGIFPPASPPLDWRHFNVIEVGIAINPILIFFQLIVSGAGEFRFWAIHKFENGFSHFKRRLTNLITGGQVERGPSEIIHSVS